MMENVVAEAYREESGMKFSSDKVDMTMIPQEVLEFISVIFMYGEGKYARDNWKKVPKDEYLKAAMRHLAALLQGEGTDSESQLAHIDHAIVCLMMYRSSELREMTDGSLNSKKEMLKNYLAAMRTALREHEATFKEKRDNSLKY